MVYIIGAGLAGSILKRVLDKEKIPNIIYDAEKPWRASIISENLFSLSWSKALGNSVVANGVKTLESIVDIQSIHFKTKAGHNDVLYVPVNNILTRYRKEQVSDDVMDGWAMDRKKSIVVDCRGFWSMLPKEYKMVGLAGQGIMLAGRLGVIEPQMDFVAPYTHQKLFQLNNGKDFGVFGKHPTIWYGDSTCVEYSKYLKAQDWYLVRCKQRASALMGAIGLPINRSALPMFGIRPWVKPMKGFLQFHNRMIWNNGGWKCGLIIYADHAQKILKYLKQKKYV